MEKVIAHITQGDRLLVFRHPQHPEARVQVPAGTVEQGEKLEEAVLARISRGNRIGGAGYSILSGIVRF